MESRLFNDAVMVFVKDTPPNSTIVLFAKGASLEDPVVIFADGAFPDGFKAYKAGKMGMRISTGQDPGTMNGRARLYAYILVISVLKRAGLGISSSIMRKNAS
jgi:hypothetical protein